MFGRRSSVRALRVSWGAASVLLCMTVLVVRARAAVPEFARDADWTEVRSERLSVLSDGTGIGWDLVYRLERFANALSALNPDLSARTAAPMTVVAFRNQEELNEYRLDRAENMIAYFLDSPERHYLVVNAQPEQMSRSEVVFHEFVHAYLTANYPAIPLWLNEGLAEYYSTCRLTTSGAEFGYPSRNVVRWFRGKQPLDLSMLFAMTTTSPAYLTSNYLQHLFYAESYALTHYLYSTKDERGRRFIEYLSRLRRGAAPMAAFREVFPSESWNAIVNAMADHVDQMDFEPTRRVRFENAEEKLKVVDRRVSTAEALTSLGELRLALGGNAKAEEHFVAALELDSTYARADAGAGMVHARAGRRAESERSFERALALAPNDARIWNTTARGALEREALAPEASRAAGAFREACRLARVRYRRSLELDPDNYHALGGYGQTFAMSGDRADSLAIQGLRRAVGAHPGRSDLSAALAVLLEQEGRTAEASELLSTRVGPAGGSRAVEGARLLIGASALEKADSLVRAGRRAEADSLLARLSGSDPSSDVRDGAASRLDELRSLTVSPSWTDSVNAAVDLSRAGRLEEARLAFQRARALAAEPSQVEFAESGLKLVEADLKLRQAARLATAGKLVAAERLLADSAFASPTPEFDTARRQSRSELRARIQIERALASVKAGRLVEARALFARVAEMAVQEDLRQYARERMRELDAALKR